MLSHHLPASASPSAPFLVEPPHKEGMSSDIPSYSMMPLGIAVGPNHLRKQYVLLRYWLRWRQEELRSNLINPSDLAHKDEEMHWPFPTAGEEVLKSFGGRSGAEMPLKMPQISHLSTSATPSGEEVETGGPPPSTTQLVGNPFRLLLGQRRSLRQREHSWPRSHGCSPMT